MTNSGEIIPSTSTKKLQHICPVLETFQVEVVRVDHWRNRHQPHISSHVHRLESDLPKFPLAWRQLLSTRRGRSGCVLWRKCQLKRISGCWCCNDMMKFQRNHKWRWIIGLWSACACKSLQDLSDAADSAKQKASWTTWSRTRHWHEKNIRFIQSNRPTWTKHIQYSPPTNIRCLCVKIAKWRFPPSKTCHPLRPGSNLAMKTC